MGDERPTAKRVLEVLDSAGLDAEIWSPETWQAMACLTQSISGGQWASIENKGNLHRLLQSLLAVLGFLASHGSGPSAGAPMEEEDAEQTAAQTGPSPTPHSGNRAQRCDLTLPCAINALRALDDFFYAAAPREDADDALGAKQDGALVATARCVALALVRAGVVELCARVHAARSPPRSCEWLRLLGSCSTLLAGMHAVALAAEQVRPAPAPALHHPALYLAYGTAAPCRLFGRPCYRPSHGVHLCCQ